MEKRVRVAECSGWEAWLPHRQEPVKDRGECAAPYNREPTATGLWLRAYGYGPTAKQYIFNCSSDKHHKQRWLTARTSEWSTMKHSRTQDTWTWEQSASICNLMRILMMCYWLSLIEHQTRLGETNIRKTLILCKRKPDGRGQSTR